MPLRASSNLPGSVSRRRFVRWASSLLVVTSLTSSAKAADYFVDGQTGLDTATGQSAHEAFRSFARAMKILAPGDRLIVADGRYFEPLVVTASGTAQAPIAILAAPGAHPQIRSALDTISVRANYVEIAGFDAASLGSGGNAIVIEVDHHHVTIRDNVAHDAACAGIGALRTDYLTITGNRVYGNSRLSPWQCSGISIYQAKNFDEAPGVHNIISRNIVYDNMNRVTDPKISAAFKGHTTDGNGIIVDDFRHTQIWKGEATPPYRGATLVENNVAFDNGGRGIQVYKSDDVLVRNNTSFHNLKDSNLFGTAFAEMTAGFTSNVRFINNIVEPSRPEVYGFLSIDSTAVSWDYNLVIGGNAAGYKIAGGEGRWDAHNALAADAKFVAGVIDPAKANFKLKPGSPARGHGTAVDAPHDDLDGNARAANEPIDLGAFQERVR